MACTCQQSQLVPELERLIRAEEELASSLSVNLELHSTVVPTPGAFYTIRYGEGGLLTTAQRAYKTTSNTERLKRARVINDHPRNRRFWKPPSNSFQRKYFGDGIIDFTPSFTCGTVQRRAARGQKRCFARIWIPEATSDEPADSNSPADVAPTPLKPDGRKWITGIDVSKWQGQVDWLKVAAAGHVFAFCKATEGVGYVDPTFHENWKGIKDAKMIRGAYHFARVNTPVDKDARDEAKHFATTVGSLGRGDLPLALDIEWDKRAKAIQPSEIVRWCQVFLTTIYQLTNKKPIVYTGFSFWKYRLARTPALSQYLLWQADVNSTAKPKSIPGWPAAFWQWSHVRPVPGVKAAKVDENRFLGPLEALKRLAGL